MGLDMFLYKMEKLNKEVIAFINKENINANELRDKNFLVFVANEDSKKDLHLIKPIIEKGFAYKTNVIVEYYDIEKIKKDNGIPKTAATGGRCYTGTEVTFRFYWWNYKKNKSVTLSLDEIQEKYIIKKNEDAYVAKYSEADYWRKHYDLQEKIYEILNNQVENCGYYPLTEEQLNEIYKYLGKNVPEYDENNEILVYHEWY